MNHARFSAIIIKPQTCKKGADQIDPNLLWFVSSDGSNYPVGSIIKPEYGNDIQSTGKAIRALRVC